MNIAGRLQDQINATQALDALTYGIRAAEAGGIYGSCEAYAAQITDAQAVADWRLARGGHRQDLSRLKAAKKLLAADLAAIKARLRMAGTKGQLRLALAAA